MCLNIEVILPTVNTCLLLYPLRNGCIVITLWTLLRTGFDVIFFSTALLEVLVLRPFPLGQFLVHKEDPVIHYYLVFYAYVILLLNEFVLLVYTMHLAVGVFQETPYLLRQYLICRAVTWFVEILFLPILCFLHNLLIGWYLGILIFVVLEFYAFIVVFSFYCDII